MHYVILFISLFILVLGISSESYADTISEIREDLQILGQKGVIGTDVYTNINLNGYNSYSNYAIIIGQGSKNENYSQPLKLPTTKYIYILANNGATIGNQASATNNMLYYMWNNVNLCNWYDINTGAKKSSGSFAGNDLIQPYYIFTTMSINTREIQLDANSEYGGSYLTQQFVFNSRGSIVNINDYNDVNAIKVNYSYIILGNVEQYLDDYDYYKYVLFDNNGIKVASVQTKKGQNWFWGNDGMTYYPGTETIELQRRLVNLKEIYTLAVYISDEQINQENTNIDDSYVITYIFLPNNAVITNGSITDYGSGDSYNSQDSTNDIINNINDSSEVTNIMESFFPIFGSGNASGELSNIATEFGFTPLDNPFTTFLLHILESSYDALTLREPVVLSADYKTMHFVLSSEQFRTPDSNLKNFIRNCMIFLYLYGNYVFFHHLITLVETARIDKAVAALGTDEFYDSDIL